MKYVNIPVQKANQMLRKFGKIGPEELAHELGITVIRRNFTKQKGVYIYFERNPYIILKEDLRPVMRSIVLLHEIGHHLLHRKQAIALGGLREFNLFDMQESRMEYEANVFAAEYSLDTQQLLELISENYDIQQIASSMYSDINLVALKVAELNRQGHRFNETGSNGRFLRG